MSKANRIKGKFCKLTGCRLTSDERQQDLAQRKEGVGERHQPKPKLSKPKLTKAQRKLVRASKKYSPKDAAKQEVSDRGYAKVIGLVTSAITPPEISLV